MVDRLNPFFWTDVLEQVHEVLKFEDLPNITKRLFWQVSEPLKFVDFPNTKRRFWEAFWNRDMKCSHFTIVQYKTSFLTGFPGLVVEIAEHPQMSIELG